MGSGPRRYVHMGVRDIFGDDDGGLKLLLGHAKLRILQIKTPDSSKPKLQIPRIQAPDLLKPSLSRTQTP